MMNAKKNWQHLLTAAATTAVLALSAGAYAEWGERGEGCDHGPMGKHRMMGGMMGDPEHRLHKMAKFLDLSDEQQAQMEAYIAPLKDAHKARREAHEQLHQDFRQAVDEGATDAQLRALAEQLGQMVAQGAMTRVKTMQYFKSILTPEQLEKLEKMKEMRGPRKGRHS